MTVSAKHEQTNTRRCDSLRHWCWKSMIVRAPPALFALGPVSGHGMSGVWWRQAYLW